MINVKPFREYDEHDVVNLFALNANSGNEGEFVSVNSSGFVNGDIYRDISLTSVSNIVSNRRVLKPEIKLATSGQDKGDVLGILLKNVRSVDYLGRDLVYDDTRKTEMNAVLSGEAALVLRRGMVLVSGIEGGTPKVGSGVAVSNSVAGGWRVYDAAAESTVKTLGTIWGEEDADGYALVYIDC